MNDDNQNDTDYTEQKRLLNEAKDKHRALTDSELQSHHLMLGLTAGSGNNRENFFAWLACAELLFERGYELNERYGIWQKGDNNHE